MNIPSKKFQTSRRLVATAQENPSPENPSVDTPQKDPLISQGLQAWQYAGIFALAIAAVAVVGAFSRRVEYVLLFAITLSAILIVFFLTG